MVDAPKLNMESIFEEYKNRIYRLALSITRNQDDAEDIIQNVFLKIMKNLRYLRNKSFLSTWVYKITYNEALMSLRKRKSQFRLSNDLKRSRDKGTSGLFINWSKMPDEQLLDSELKERIEAAIRHMTIKYRMPLLLENVEGLSMKDSARILDIKISSLKTRLHRARLNLRSEMADYLKDKEEEAEKKSRKCSILLGFIYKYAHRTLGKRKSQAFRRHIKRCQRCHAFLHTYFKAINMTRALECQDLPDELKQVIAKILFKNKTKKH